MAKEKTELENVAKNGEKVKKFLQSDAFRSAKKRPVKDSDIHIKVDATRKTKLEFIGKKMNMGTTSSIEFMIDTIYEALNN